MIYDEKEYDLDEEYFKNDGFYVKYGDLYKDKIVELNRSIFYSETGTDKYMILNTEASLGKSLNTAKLIRRYYQDSFVQKNILVVKRFRKDIVELVEFLSDVQPNYFCDLAVLGITSENWTEWRNQTHEFKNIKVIIITHQRYISICESEKLKHAFSENRDILIIDEKVEFPVYSFSKATYDYVQTLLPLGLEDELSKVSKPLKDMISFYYNDHSTRNKVLFCTPKISKKVINKFAQLVNDNIEHINPLRVNDIECFIKTVKLMCDSKCLYNGGRLTTYDKDTKLWGLNNNIILDASGDIDYVYRLSATNYSLNRQVRIVDDRNINIYPIYYNSSASNIKKNHDEYLEAIMINVLAQYRTGDKTLIVCHKGLAEDLYNNFLTNGYIDVALGDDYVDQTLAINWFGNLIGKNQYMGFNVCWIVGKPNIPLESYIVHYMQYSQRDTIGRKSLDIEGGKFKNNIFKSIQEGEVASEIYQSIKRIQRNSEPRGRIFIVLNDEDILKRVLDDMNNPTVHDVIPLVEHKMREQEVMKDRKVDDLVTYIKSLKCGRYEKKMICEKLDIQNKKLYRYLNNVKINSLVESGYIQMGRLHLDVIVEMTHSQ